MREVALRVDARVVQEVRLQVDEKGDASALLSKRMNHPHRADRNIHPRSGHSLPAHLGVASLALLVAGRGGVVVAPAKLVVVRVAHRPAHPQKARRVLKHLSYQGTRVVGGMCM